MTARPKPIPGGHGDRQMRAGAGHLPVPDHHTCTAKTPSPHPPPARRAGHPRQGGSTRSPLGRAGGDRTLRRRRTTRDAGGLPQTAGLNAFGARDRTLGRPNSGRPDRSQGKALGQRPEAAFWDHRASRLASRSRHTPPGRETSNSGVTAARLDPAYLRRRCRGVNETDRAYSPLHAARKRSRSEGWKR